MPLCLHFKSLQKGGVLALSIAMIMALIMAAIITIKAYRGFYNVKKVDFLTIALIKNMIMIVRYQAKA